MNTCQVFVHNAAIFMSSWKIYGIRRKPDCVHKNQTHTAGLLRFNGNNDVYHVLSHKFFSGITLHVIPEYDVITFNVDKTWLVDAV